MTTQIPARQPKKRSSVVASGVTIVSFVALLYVIEAFDQIDHNRLDEYGIRPMEKDGLWGILFAPLLHASWAHLAANTGPALVLGFLVAMSGLSRFFWATAIIWLVGGLGTWLIGDWGSSCGDNTTTYVVGASGVIFGWLTFLLVFGFLIRSGWQIVIGLLVLVVYGGVLWGAVPVLNVCGGVSWQGHLCGGIAGVLAAYLLSSPEREARERRRKLPQR